MELRPMSESDDKLPGAEAPYHLAPETPQQSVRQSPRPLSGTPEELKAIRAVLLPERGENEQRFSLTGLFAVVTFASIVLGLGSYLPPAIFAGAAGAATLAGMFALSLLRAPPLVMQLGWWLLLALYLMAIGRAIWA